MADDDEDNLELQRTKRELERFKSRFGAKVQYSDDSDSSDMEAGYDSIDEEERYTSKVARREDRMEEERNRRIEERAREKKRMKRHGE